MYFDYFILNNKIFILRNGSYFWTHQRYHRAATHLSKYLRYPKWFKRGGRKLKQEPSGPSTAVNSPYQ